jgi:hypothetical protein
MFWIINLLLLHQSFTVKYTPADFAWENRLIIINGKCDCSIWFSEISEKDLLERKLLVFHFEDSVLIDSNFDGEVNTNSFLKLSSKSSSELVRWVLIGLDGGVKKSGNSTPNQLEIHRTIDSMPMRRSEILKKS